MDQIVMSGLDWTVASLEVRERFTLTQGQVMELDEALCAIPGVSGGVILSTCNRTEVYLSVTGDNLHPGALLCHLLGVECDGWTCRTGSDAARHLMEVAGGLQSHIWGEDQIVTQVKAAIALAREVGSATPQLETLFRCAATAGKEIKNKVRLSGASASAAAEAAAWLDASVSNPRPHAMVIGNGEMGQLCAQALLRRGWAVTVTLRTYRHGSSLVPYGCRAVPFDERYQHMSGLDALVSATTSPHFTIGVKEFSCAYNPPKLIADLAVPRDIDPAIGQLDGVVLRNIDDLGGEEERSIPAAAMEIIDRQLLQLEQWNRYRRSLPALERLKEAVTRRVVSSVEEGDEALIALAVSRAVDLLSGGLKEHLDPDALEEHTRKIERHTRERAKPAEPRAPLRFPLFIDLTGQPTVIVGGGTIACRRAEVLRRFGARVTIIAPECKTPPQNVEWLAREYCPGDLEGCILAVAATDDRAVNRQVGLDAKALGIPVSVADARDECTFFVPAVCVSDDLVAGVVSDGANHHRTARAARAIRATLEELE